MTTQPKEKKQDWEKYKAGEIVGFAGILSTETRKGKFVRKISEYLVEIDYGDHTEQNHISNIYKL